MIVTQQATFTEDSGQAANYTASFTIPANAVLVEVRMVNQSVWNDSAGGPLLNVGFNGTSSPYVLQENLKDSTSRDSLAAQVGSVSGASYGAIYSSSRTLTASVSGNNNDGSAGVTIVIVKYYVTDIDPIVTVVRS